MSECGHHAFIKALFSTVQTVKLHVVLRDDSNHQGYASESDLLIRNSHSIHAGSIEHGPLLIIFYFIYYVLLRLHSPTKERQ